MRELSVVYLQRGVMCVQRARAASMVQGAFLRYSLHTTTLPQALQELEALKELEAGQAASAHTEAALAHAETVRTIRAAHEVELRQEREQRCAVTVDRVAPSLLEAQGDSLTFQNYTRGTVTPCAGRR